ncbi:hypothetical protein HDU83_000393 [Entophlyctis luteolus]|nr:hypothetical protein HDU83_000393 [Entophlyctis luteolus]
MLARLDQSDRAREDMRQLGVLRGSGGSVSPDRESSDDDAVSVATSTDTQHSSEDDSDYKHDDPSRPPLHMLYCQPCRKFVSVDSFSAKQQKERDYRERYCLRHTSTSSYDRTYSVPESLPEQPTIPELFAMDESHDSDETETPAVWNTTSKPSAKITTAEAEFLNSFSSDESILGNGESDASPSRGNSCSGSDEQQGNSDSQEHQTVSQKQKRRKILSEFQKRRLERKSKNQKQDSSKMAMPPSRVVGDSSDEDIKKGPTISCHGKAISSKGPNRNHLKRVRDSDSDSGSQMPTEKQAFVPRRKLNSIPKQILDGDE